MKKLLKRRPSAGTLIAFLALCVALGGGAYAATSHKVEYKGLTKDARLKVLPVSATNAGGSDSGGTDCDPNSSSTFTQCTSVSLETSTAFPRKILLIFDGTFKAVGGASTGECQLQIDSSKVTGTTTKIDVPSTTDPKSYGINIVAKPTSGGTHTYSVNCKESTGDLRVTQFELSAATVR
jgi:hypothetical protein